MSLRATSTLTTVLVDDEPLAREELEYLLRDFPEVEVAGVATNGLEALQIIEKIEPDLVFLDVQMPGLDGLGLIRRLKEQKIHLPYFVLATAFDQYAIEAFRLEAMDYILKPIEKDRLRQTIERARKQIVPPPDFSAETRSSVPKTKLVVRAGSRNIIVDASDMIFATIDDGLIRIVTSALTGESTYKSIDELHNDLDEMLFWRVHRGYLVNINRIREVNPWFHSSLMLKMDDPKGTEVPVSRAQAKRLRAFLKL